MKSLVMEENIISRNLNQSLFNFIKYFNPKKILYSSIVNQNLFLES